jgi:proliferating cell nuclear antigen PCNA
MKIVFASAKKCQQFAAIFANLKNFTDNMSIYFKADHIYIQCMDDSHCSLFECQLSRAWFKTYDFDPVSDMATIGINIVMLNKILNMWNESQELTIETEPESDKLYISFENANNAAASGQFNKYFEISLVDISSELMDVVLGDTTVDMTIESKVFHSLISQMTTFDDVLTLNFGEEEVECVSSGSDGSMTAKIDVGWLAAYAIPESTMLKQSYSLKYVQTMCQFHKLAPEMELGFVEDRPMVMKYALGDNNDPDSFVRIHLAPKIVDEDNE